MCTSWKERIILMDIKSPVSANLELSKKDITITHSSTILHPNETIIIELKTSFGKKIKKLAICDGKGKFTIRDLRKLGDKLDEYEKLLKDKKISLEEYSKLKKKAIDEEINE